MGPRLHRPEGMDDGEWEAYLQGFRTAMSMVASSASVLAAGASSGPPLAMDPPWGPRSEEDGEEEEYDGPGVGACPECGGPMVEAMGQDGPFCPAHGPPENRPEAGQEGA